MQVAAFQVHGTCAEKYIKSTIHQNLNEIIINCHTVLISHAIKLEKNVYTEQ